jgi:hypothetical protein
MIEKFEAASKLNRAVNLSSMVSRKFIRVSRINTNFAGSSLITRLVIAYSSLDIKEL